MKESNAWETLLVPNFMISFLNGCGFVIYGKLRMTNKSFARMLDNLAGKIPMVGFYDKQIEHLREHLKESGSSLPEILRFSYRNSSMVIVPYYVKMRSYVSTMGDFKPSTPSLDDAVRGFLTSGHMFREKRASVYKIVDEYCHKRVLGIEGVETIMDIFDNTVENFIVKRDGNLAKMDLYSTTQELIGYLFASVVIGTHVVSNLDTTVSSVIDSLSLGDLFTCTQLNQLVSLVLNGLKWKLPWYSYTDALRDATSLSRLFTTIQDPEHRIPILQMSRVILDEWLFMAQWMQTGALSANNDDVKLEECRLPMETMGCGKLTIASAAVFLAVWLHETRLYGSADYDNDERYGRHESLDAGECIKLLGSEMESMCGGNSFGKITGIMLGSLFKNPPYQRCSYLRKAQRLLHFRCRLQDDKHNHSSMLVAHGSNVCYDEHVYNGLGKSVVSH